MEEMIMVSEQGNGNGKKKWKDKTLLEKALDFGKYLAAVAVAVTALFSYCESEMAHKRSKKSASEDVAKATHNELVKKVNALAFDFDLKETALRKYIQRWNRRNLRLVAQAKSESRACQSLFIGHALAGIRRPAQLRKELSKLTKTIARKAVKSSPPDAPAPPKRIKRRFLKVRSYLKVKQSLRRQLK